MVLQTHKTQNHPELLPDETGYHRKELTSKKYKHYLINSFVVIKYFEVMDNIFSWTFKKKNYRKMDYKQTFSEVYVFCLYA